MRGLRREELQEQALQAFLVLLDDSSMRGLRRNADAVAKFSIVPSFWTIPR